MTFFVCVCVVFVEMCVCGRGERERARERERGAEEGDDAYRAGRGGGVYWMVGDDRRQTSCHSP